MMSARVAKILLILALTVAFFPQDATARKADIVDTEVDRNSDLIVIGFRVDGAFTQSIQDVIHSGAPTTFTYLVELFKSVPNLPDERMSTRTIQRTIQYDTLKQRYVVTEDAEQRVAVGLTEAERMMTEIHGFPVTSASSLQSEAGYYVLVKAELDEVRLPFVFSFLRLFVQLWDFETRWTRIDLPGSE